MSFNPKDTGIVNNSGIYPSSTTITSDENNIRIVSDGDPYPAKAGNPLFIKTQPTTGTDNQVLGILGQGSTSGNIVWTPSYIGTFYYQSSVDDSMGGQIIVS